MKTPFNLLWICKGITSTNQEVRPRPECKCLKRHSRWDVGWYLILDHFGSTLCLTVSHSSSGFKKFVLVFSPISWLRLKACWLLVPQPGIEPVPPAVEARCLNHWTAREVPHLQKNSVQKGLKNHCLKGVHSLPVFLFLRT